MVQSLIGKEISAHLLSYRFLLNVVFFLGAYMAFGATT